MKLLSFSIFLSSLLISLSILTSEKYQIEHLTGNIFLRLNKWTGETLACYPVSKDWPKSSSHEVARFGSDAAEDDPVKTICWTKNGKYEEYAP